MPDTEKDIYDLNKLEDMFEVIDSLTRATATLSSIDQQLAGDLVRLTNTLLHLSESGQSVGFIPEDTGDRDENPYERRMENGIEDLTFSKPVKPKANFMDNDENDFIIDVLTGEKIK